MKSGWSSRQVSDRPPAYDFSLLEATARGVSSAYREQLLDELTFVVFDTETTGLDPAAGDRIISLAGVKVRKRVVRRAETFDALVNPGRRVPAASTKFHGITFEMVAEAPALDAVLPAFLRFAEGAVLVGHEVWFELRFLNLERGGGRDVAMTLTTPVFDTALLSRVVQGRLGLDGLDQLAARLGVVVHGRPSALGDALATAEIFVRLLGLLQRRGIRTLGQALDAASLAGREIAPDTPSEVRP